MKKDLVDDKKSYVVVNDLKEVSRLLIQRILLSSATRFLDKKTYDTLSSAFLSEEPDKQIGLRFRINTTNPSSYYDQISDFSFRWEPSQESIDADGNVWRDFRLITSALIASCHEPSQFIERLICLNAIDALIKELHSVAPLPLRVKFMNNEQRIAKENEKKLQVAISTFVLAMRTHCKKARFAMRKDGNFRPLPQELASLFNPGTYYIDVNDGSARAPRVKKYLVKIPDDNSRARFQRVH